MAKERTRLGILAQVATFFVVAAFLTGLFAYINERENSNRSITEGMERTAHQISREVVSAVETYPAHEWLMRFWFRHADELDIEYDALPEPDTETARKALLFSERHPDIPIRYATTYQLIRIPREDQILYAEIVYSWLLTQLDQIKAAYGMDYIFCVISDKPYDSQFFLLTAAQPGAVRGTGPEDAYILGKISQVAESQQKAMENALRNTEYFADAGDYVDYYAYLGTFDNHSVFVGITYNVAEIRSNILSDANLSVIQAMLYQGILSALCLTLIFFFVLNPLRRVQSSIRTYTQTKDSDSVTREIENDLKGFGAIAVRGNEIGELSEDFVVLMEEIDDYVASIEMMTIENERIGAELSLAARIQEASLPNTFPAFPDRTEFDLFASMDPAREVGGDFYDFFFIDNDHLCIEIADVSGKGVPAALFMMITKALLKNCAMIVSSPAEILMRTNSIICSNNRENMFVTVWLGILEISTGKIVACNAGHEKPIIGHADGTFEVLQDKHGPIVGFMDGVRYKEYELTVVPGDKIFVYTDGLPEAQDADNKMFGMDNTARALAALEDTSPTGILEGVRAAVDDFVKDAEQFDDLTMLCIEYRGCSAE